MRILIIVSLLFVPFVRADTATETTNVCHLERKNITCSRDSVIYIDSARFGRMKADICFSNIGYLNCWADVQLYLDRKCGGRRWCLLELDSVLDGSNHGCHAEFRTYLEVSHHCLRVETARNGHSSQCPGDKLTYPVGMETSAADYLARVVTMETRIGSIDCPWSIEVRLGQTVRLTLYDFGIWQDPGSGNPAAGNNTCQVYATVTELSGSVGPRLICGRVTGLGRGQDRGRVVYTSNTNSVQVAVMTGKSSTLEQFLLKYEAVGCADPVPSPPNTSFERISDRLVIKCIKENNEDPEQKTWTIQCLADGNWSMSFHEINCSTASALESESVAQKTVSYATFISVVTAGICVIIISNIIVATVVRRRCSNVASNSDTKENMSYQELEMTRRQANPETSYMYIGVQPQPVYEEVIRH